MLCVCVMSVNIMFLFNVCYMKGRRTAGLSYTVVGGPKAEGEKSKKKINK